MKKLQLLTLSAGILFLGACTHNANSPEMIALQQTNDSLLQANAEMRNGYEEMISFIADIETDMQSIKQAENFVIQQQNETGEMTLSTQERVKRDIELISNTLQRNKERIAELEQRLRNSNSNSAALKKAIDNLNAQIAEKDSMIVGLQSALAARDIRIAELDAAVDTLKGQVTDLSRIQNEQSAIIASQDMALNEVRYVYANSNQLREHNIISGGGLFSKTKVMEGDFDVNFFTTADQRTLTTIFLESKKAKILTKHPQGSYELIKDAEGFYTLNITNVGNFWSLSRYLVVEID